jgi:hypothetical protein
MAWKLINVYKAYWRQDKNYGFLRLYYAGGVSVLRIESPQEMLLLLDIIRNEKPVWCETVSKAITTGAEPVGEEET